MVSTILLKAYSASPHISLIMFLECGPIMQRNENGKTQVSLCTRPLCREDKELFQ